MLVLRVTALIFLLCLPIIAGEIPLGTPSSQNLFIIARELYGRGLLENIEYYNPPAATDAGMSNNEKDLIGLYHNLVGDYLDLK